MPNLTVLTVTTSPGRACAMLALIERRADPAYTGRFAVAYEPDFGAMWRVPKGVLSHLLDVPWMTVGGMKDIASP